MRDRFFLIPIALLFFSYIAYAQTQSCIECHYNVTPNIVSDWQLSKHAENGVECDVCHGDEHKSAADVSKVKLPTPETCAQCHETQVSQYKKGKHAIAWAAMKAMPTTHMQPMAVIKWERRPKKKSNN